MANEGQMKFLSTLSALLKEDRYCDIQIEFTNGSRKFNRLFLAALSPFFDAMLSSAMQEGLSGVVSLPTVNSEIFEAILDYYVNGVGDLDIGTLYECIDASDMMQMTDLKQICIQNMKETLTPENCLQVWLASKKYTSDKVLESRAFEIVCENFKTVHTQDEFRHLDKGDVLRFVRLKHISKESDLLETVLSWIEANSPDETDAVELFTEIRLRLVEPSYLMENVYRNGILKYQGIVSRMKEHVLQNFKVMAAESQRPNDAVDVIIVCSTSTNLFSVHAWDLKQKRWYDLSSKPQNGLLTKFAVAYSDQKIVITGGVRGKLAVSDTLTFSASENVWTIGPQLVYARSRHGSVIIQNSVYAVGGYTSTCAEGGGLQNITHFSSIEQWSPRTRKWVVVGNLAKAVADAAVTKAGHCILSFGGEDCFQKVSGEIQCFNTISKCSFVVGITEKCDYNGSDIFAQKLYLFATWVIDVFEIKDGRVATERTERIYIPSCSRASKCAGVVLGDKAILYTPNFTREIHLSKKDVKPITLPTVPGDTNGILCAFRAGMSNRCLLSD